MPKTPLVWKRPKYLPPETSLGAWRVIDRMMRYVRRRGTVIQAGAHVGLWPAVLSQYFNQVVSFEPVAKLAAVAREAAPYPNVKVYEQVLSDSIGERLLHVPEGEKMARYSGSATINEHGQPVEAVTIDSIAPEMKRDLGAIMLDIEGHEGQALRGALETIREWRPVIVVEENAKSLRYRGPGEIGAFLDAYGYSLQDSFRGDLIFSVDS